MLVYIFLFYNNLHHFVLLLDKIFFRSPKKTLAMGVLAGYT